MSAKSTSLLSAAVLALSSLPSAMAASCSAVGYYGDNSIWNPDGGPTVTGNQDAKVYKNGDFIYEYQPCDTCSSMCSDYIGLDAHHEQLDQTFGWAASCNNRRFT